MAQSPLVRTRPLRRLTRAELKNYLEKAANILRGNVDHSEFRGYVFALLFYKRISDVYLEEVEALTAKLGDPELSPLPVTRVDVKLSPKIGQTEGNCPQVSPCQIPELPFA